MSRRERFRFALYIGLALLAVVLMLAIPNLVMMHMEKNLGVVNTETTQQPNFDWMGAEEG